MSNYKRPKGKGVNAPPSPLPRSLNIAKGRRFVRSEDTTNTFTTDAEHTTD